MTIEDHVAKNLIKPFIVGADEVGYGSLCGEIVVCGVRAPKDWHIEGLNDSKKLSKKQRHIMRDKLIQCVLNEDITFHIADRTNKIIDEFGIATVLKDCYIEVFKALYTLDSLIVCDGMLKFDNPLVNDYDKISLIKADSKISAVMAASILGKTYRDTKMELYAKDYPQYGWESNAGYGAKIHKEALEKFGITPLHRMSYAPMKNMQ